MRLWPHCLAGTLSPWRGRRRDSFAEHGCRGGAAGSMRPWVAVACLAAALAALLLVVCLADRTFFLPQAGLVKPPAVLADKAESMISRPGQPAAQSRTVAGLRDQPRLPEIRGRQRGPAPRVGQSGCRASAGGLFLVPHRRRPDRLACLARRAVAGPRLPDRARGGHSPFGRPGKAAAIRGDAGSQRLS